jgi:hypothetical protein
MRVLIIPATAALTWALVGLLNSTQIWVFIIASGVGIILSFAHADEKLRGAKRSTRFDSLLLISLGIVFGLIFN